MYCMNCGAEVTGKFCAVCGTPVVRPENDVPMQPKSAAGKTAGEQPQGNRSYIPAEPSVPAGTKKTRKKRNPGKIIAVILVLLLAALLVTGGVLLVRSLSKGSIFVKQEKHLVIGTADETIYLDSGDNEVLGKHDMYWLGEKGFTSFVYTRNGRLHYSDGKDSVKIANVAWMQQMYDSGTYVVYVDYDEGEYCLWSQKNKESVTLAEDILYCDSAVFSGNGRYLVSVLVDTEELYGLYITDTSNGNTELLEEGGYIYVAYVSDKGAIVYLDDDSSLMYDTGKDSVRLERNVSQVYVYEEQGRMVYCTMDGDLYVKSVDGEKNAEQIDEDVDWIYYIGKSTADDRDENEYTVASASAAKIGESVAAAILYRKDEETWYTELKSPSPELFCSDDIYEGMYLKFADKKTAYYSFDGKLYKVKKARNGWETERLSRHCAYSFALFDGKSRLIYQDDSSALYVYAGGEEIELTDSSTGYEVRPDSEEIVYAENSKIYYLSDAKAEPVRVARDAMSYSNAFVYDGYIYYISKDEELIRVSKDGRKDEVVLEEVSWFQEIEYEK